MNHAFVGLSRNLRFFKVTDTDSSKDFISDPSHVSQIFTRSGGHGFAYTDEGVPDETDRRIQVGEVLEFLSGFELALVLERIGVSGRTDPGTSASR